MQSPPEPTPADGGTWQPASSVEPIRGGYIVRFALAGIRPADVELRHSNGRICVGGVRRELQAHPGERLPMDVVWRRFESCVELPVAIEDCTMSCDFRDGALVVTVLARDPDTGNRPR
jgi:HSP20 family molecular chaperone IbpA